jgi:hypothetical protein
MFSRSLANGSFVGGVAIGPVSGSNIAVRTHGALKVKNGIFLSPLLEWIFFTRAVE